MTNWLKYIFVTVLFFILVLMQNNFLPHIAIINMAPNLVFMLFFTLIFFEKSNDWIHGIFFTITAGFLLDLFSSLHFGPNIIFLLLTYVTIKTLLYFLKERQEKYLFFYFIPIFIISFSLYQILIYVWVNFPHINMNLQPGAFTGLLINTGVSLIVFFIYRYGYYKSDRQLKLF